MPALADCATAECAAPAERALAFLADGLALGRWAFGCWDTVLARDGLYRGHSLFDGAETWVRPVLDGASSEVRYLVGGAPERLAARIVAKVMPGPAVGRPADRCLVSLIAWRDAAWDDARWQRLVACHAAEILLIQGLLASPSPHRGEGRGEGAA